VTAPTKHTITWVDPRRRAVLARQRAEHQRMPLGRRGNTARIRWKRVLSRINCHERDATRRLVLSDAACQGLRWLLKGTHDQV
jgi:hypothetical protein